MRAPRRGVKKCVSSVLIPFFVVLFLVLLVMLYFVLTEGRR